MLFGYFFLPISEYSFNLRAIRDLYKAKTTEEDLFKLPKKTKEDPSSCEEDRLQEELEKEEYKLGGPSLRTTHAQRTRERKLLR